MNIVKEKSVNTVPHFDICGHSRDNILQCIWHNNVLKHVMYVWHILLIKIDQTRTKIFLLHGT